MNNDRAFFHNWWFWIWHIWNVRIHTWISWYWRNIALAWILWIYRCQWRIVFRIYWSVAWNMWHHRLIGFRISRDCWNLIIRLFWIEWIWGIWSVFLWNTWKVWDPISDFLVDISHFSCAFNHLTSLYTDCLAWNKDIGWAFFFDLTWFVICCIISCTTWCCNCWYNFTIFCLSNSGRNNNLIRIGFISRNGVTFSILVVNDNGTSGSRCCFTYFYFTVNISNCLSSFSDFTCFRIRTFLDFHICILSTVCRSDNTWTLVSCIVVCTGISLVYILNRCISACLCTWNWITWFVHIVDNNVTLSQFIDISDGLRIFSYFTCFRVGAVFDLSVVIDFTVWCCDLIRTFVSCVVVCTGVGLVLILNRCVSTCFFTGDWIAILVFVLNDNITLNQFIDIGYFSCTSWKSTWFCAFRLVFNQFVNFAFWCFDTWMFVVCCIVLGISWSRYGWYNFTIFCLSNSGRNNNLIRIGFISRNGVTFSILVVNDNSTFVFCRCFSYFYFCIFVSNSLSISSNLTGCLCITFVLTNT